MQIRMKYNWVVAVLIVVGIGLLYFISTMRWNQQKKTLYFVPGSDFDGDPGYEEWPEFTAPDSEKTEKEFQLNCISRYQRISIANLGNVINDWAKTTNTTCRKLLGTFNTLYELSLRNSSLFLPTPFQAKVKSWLGNKEELFQEVYHQEIIHVVNRFTREHTIFNPLRDKRPVLPPDEPEIKYYDDIVDKTRKNCDFCNFKNYTAEHRFHRVENKYAFSASNTFKMDTLHALLALKQHDPIEWSPEAFMGLMELTLTWFQKAHKSFPSAKFPSMIWDVLPKCGASQVHPHLHGFLDPERYHGVIESWRLGAQDYYRIAKRNFYSDMARVAASLGLAVTHKTATAFASLVPRKDHEVIVMAPSADKDFFEMVYFVLRAFLDDLDKYCFSMGLAYPALDGHEAVIPAYARIITRGVVTDIRTDMSSLELFTATNVNIDPFQVAKLVRDSKNKRRSAFAKSSSRDAATSH